MFSRGDCFVFWILCAHTRTCNVQGRLVTCDACVLMIVGGLGVSRNKDGGERIGGKN